MKALQLRLEERRTPSLPVCMMVLFAGFATNIAAQSYTVIDVPGGTGVHPVSINNGGDVAGYFCQDGTDCYSARGFVRTFNGNITVFDGIPSSINDAGAVTGSFGSLGDFLRDPNGSITMFLVPQRPPGYPTASFAMAMNNSGEIAGYLIPCPMCDTDQAFVRDRSGEITTFSIQKGLVATSINARGDITGHNAPFYVSQDGFVRNRNGDVTVFDVPGATGPGPLAYPLSINNGGDIAGYYYDAKYTRLRGFVRERDGNITVFDGIPSSINEQGEVAGDNFLRDSKGNLTVFDVPGAFAAHTMSINDRGDVAGYFIDLRDGTSRGFIRSAH
jgi:hypothetical protein